MKRVILLAISILSSIFLCSCGDLVYVYDNVLIGTWALGVEGLSEITYTFNSDETYTQTVTAFNLEGSSSGYYEFSHDSVYITATEVSGGYITPALRITESYAYDVQDDVLYLDKDGKVAPYIKIRN